MVLDNLKLSARLNTVAFAFFYEKIFGYIGQIITVWGPFFVFGLRTFMMTRLLFDLIQKTLHYQRRSQRIY